jgi:hypothetical protein
MGKKPLKNAEKPAVFSAKKRENRVLFSQALEVNFKSANVSNSVELVMWRILVA